MVQNKFLQNFPSVIFKMGLVTKCGLFACINVEVLELVFHYDSTVPVDGNTQNLRNISSTSWCSSSDF